MNKLIFSIVGVFVVMAAIVAGVYAYKKNSQDDMPAVMTEEQQQTDGTTAGDNTAPQDQNGSGTYTSSRGVRVTLDSPAPGATVGSPLTVSGTVPGSWSFEGQFTVRLVSLKGDALAEEPATLSGDWMTDDQVPFSVTLAFTVPSEESGSLELVKANPSDLPENSDMVTIPVQFE